MSKKYELTENTITHNGIVLHQIKACRDIKKHYITAGDLGGYIEKEENLDQARDSWVSGSAKVYGGAVVYGEARVSNDAWVYGNAKVYDQARVFGYAKVYDNAEVGGTALVCNGARVYENANIMGKAEVRENASIYGYAVLRGEACVHGYAKVYDVAHISGRAMLSGWARLNGDAKATISPVVIAGLRHHITICDSHIIAGCQCRTLEEWENFGSELRDREDIKLWKIMLPSLRPVVEYHQSRVKEAAVGDKGYQE